MKFLKANSGDIITEAAINIALDQGCSTHGSRTFLVRPGKEFLIRCYINLNWCTAFKPPQPVSRERRRSMPQKL